VVVDAFDDLLAVDFEFVGSAREVLVDTRLGERFGYLDHHCAVAAGRVDEVAVAVLAVVLGADVHPVVPECLFL